ncbi:MAG: alpha-hydroxy-acid oxidizing protein, partial [Candidatus Helarchaeota archaeon]
MSEKTRNRKWEHIQACIKKDVNFRSKKTGFEDVELIHRAIPRFNFNEIDISVDFAGKTLKAPLMINAITGGHEKALKINEILGETAEKHGIAMQVGSQRAALEDPSLVSTYSIARE